MGLHAPDLDPSSVDGSTGGEMHVKELPQNSFQPHGPFRKRHTMPACAEHPVQAVT